MVILYIGKTIFIQQFIVIDWHGITLINFIKKESVISIKLHNFKLSQIENLSEHEIFKREVEKRTEKLSLMWFFSLNMSEKNVSEINLPQEI